MPMPMWAAVAAGVLLVAAPAAARTADQRVPLSAEQLDALRGGFDIPGGPSVALGVTTLTAVDGHEVLRTSYAILNSAPQLRVAANQGGMLVPITATAAGIRTTDGIVRFLDGAGGGRIELSGDAIDITHLVGQSLGSIIANAGSNRSIDTTTTVDIGLSGVTPDAIGGSLARVDDLALGATALLNH